MKKKLYELKIKFYMMIIFYCDALMFNVQECIWHGQSMVEKWRIIS
jgi:hypothetical protein